MGTVRLRILFKSKHLLTESLVKEGLDKSWIVLKSHLTTISDLSSYIRTVFHLHDACSDGLILSMDGFVLPPFESVCILKDNDIISVKRKRNRAIDKVGNRSNLIKTGECKERQPIDNGVKLLADKEFENESGGYESESEEEEPKVTLPAETVPVIKKVSKKRKASKLIHSSKRKKNKSSPTQEFPTSTADVGHDDSERNKSKNQKRDRPQKVVLRKTNSSSSSSESDTASKSSASAERVNRRGACKRNVESSSAAAESKKGPSRSTRRKKAKRQWFREQAKQKEQQQLLLGTSIEEEPSQNDDTDMEGDTVPVVIRPGHIRFEPIKKVAADQAGQQNHCPVETLHWNGITNKKKGQKWGKEKTPSWKRNNYYAATSELHDCNASTSNPSVPSGTSNKIGTTSNPPQIPTTETEQPKPPAPVVGPINFEKLRPCTRLPQEGDVVAYRLIELSSTWTPELSSFRVGKVAWHDTETNKIMIIAVPEYPFAFKKETGEDSAVQVDTFPYGEDGSLKIDYASLIDLRLVKEENMNSSKAAVGNGITSDKQSPESSFKLANNNSRANDAKQDNGKVNAWDEISQALSAKKAQLSQADGWNEEDNSGRSSWSFRAIRGSALGPTMALLRAQNEL